MKKEITLIELVHLELKIASRIKILIENNRLGSQEIYLKQGSVYVEVKLHMHDILFIEDVYVHNRQGKELPTSSIILFRSIRKRVKNSLVYHHERFRAMNEKIQEPARVFLAHT